MTFMLQANLVFLEFLKVEFEAKLQLSGPSAAEPAPILELVDLLRLVFKLSAMVDQVTLNHQGHTAVGSDSWLTDFTLPPLPLNREFFVPTVASSIDCYELLLHKRN